MENWQSIKENMEAAGCTANEISEAGRFWNAGAGEGLISCLRACRCSRIEELHKKQRQLDLIDGLIWKMKKESGGKLQ
ncbi:MAG: hypothetical protein IJU57_04690 [Clostridia bacterium]|nr:hypothetical protein [Clostridia bacterium]